MKLVSMLLLTVVAVLLSNCAPTTVQNVPRDPTQPPSNGAGYNFGSPVTKESDPTNKHLQYMGRGL